MTKPKSKSSELVLKEGVILAPFGTQCQTFTSENFEECPESIIQHMVNKGELTSDMLESGTLPEAEIELTQES
jgi:hypothetical protein